MPIVNQANDQDSDLVFLKKRNPPWGELHYIRETPYANIFFQLS